MKRYTRIVFALACLLALHGEAIAHAETLLKTSIPFSFTAGRTTLPPGAYYVDRADGSLGVLQVRGSQQVIFLASHYVLTGNTANGARLVFHRYGNRFFLREVWVADRGYPVHDTSAEREWVQAQGSGVEPRRVRLVIVNVPERR